MDKEIVKKLRAPFPKELHKKAHVSHGEVTYVEVGHYISRLNEVLDNEWTWELVEWAIRDKNVHVVGRLTICGVSKMASGGAPIIYQKDKTTKQETDKALDLGDNFKSAASDALKKAASMFGVGLELHIKDGEKYAANVRKEDATKEQVPPPASPPPANTASDATAAPPPSDEEKIHRKVVMARIEKANEVVKLYDQVGLKGHVKRLMAEKGIQAVEDFARDLEAKANEVTQ